MSDPFALAIAIEAAWVDVPAPALGDLPLDVGGWSQVDASAFRGVAPMDVDIDSAAFLASTPLASLPPRAAAAYLGTFLRALMISLLEQQVVKFFEDPFTRAHVITCLKDGRFWCEVIDTHLSDKQRMVVLKVIECMVDNRVDLALDDDDIEALNAHLAG